MFTSRIAPSSSFGHSGATKERILDVLAERADCSRALPGGGANHTRSTWATSAVLPQIPSSICGRALRDRQRRRARPGALHRDRRPRERQRRRRRPSMSARRAHLVFPITSSSTKSAHSQSLGTGARHRAGVRDSGAPRHSRVDATPARLRELVSAGTEQANAGSRAQQRQARRRQYTLTLLGELAGGCCRSRNDGLMIHRAEDRRRGAARGAQGSLSISITARIRS